MLRAAVIAIALSGCRDERLEQVRAIRDEVCACRDLKCGEEAMKKPLPSFDDKPSPRARALAAEMVTCMSKLYLKPEEPEGEESADAGSGSGSAAP